MKKIIALTLALMMLTMSFVACNNGEGETTTAPVDNGNTTTAPEANGDVTDAPSIDANTEAVVVEIPYNNSAELAEMILAAIPEDQMPPIGPMEIDLKAEGFDYALTDLGLPADFHGKISDATKVVHMMMLNQFSAGIYHFNTAEDAQASIESIKNAIANKEWMCGFPEKFVIVTLPGNYVISIFGLGGLDPDPNFALDLITPFIDAAKTVVDGVVVAVDQPLM